MSGYEHPFVLQAMDDVALTLQRQYEQNTRRYLGALVAAAVCTLVPGEAAGIAIAPAGAAIGILVALLFRRRLNGGVWADSESTTLNSSHAQQPVSVFS